MVRLFTAEEATAMAEPMAAPVARIAAIRDSSLPRWAPRWLLFPCGQVGH